MMEQVWWKFLGFIVLLNDFTTYFSILLGRCALLSFPILIFVIIMRKIFLKKKIFLKGLMWGLFLLVPFMGKLNLFYDNTWMRKSFMWWNDICMLYWWVRYGYILCILLYLVYIVQRYRKVWKQIKVMEKGNICGQRILISEMMTTPFAVGLFRAKIIIPRILLEKFEFEELKLILLHEKIHIRLGHLWFYLLWDIIRILLWPNLFLTLCMKDFKEDMEDICDRITIRRSGGSAYEYGELLIKSIKILREEAFESVTTFAGERCYRDTKQRIIKIADYKAYKPKYARILCVFCFITLAGLLLMIEKNSLPRYIEENSMVLINRDKETKILEDSETLRKAIFVDGKSVYIDRKTMDLVLLQYEIKETEFWLLFGGYTKLPGFGGKGNLVYINYTGQENVLKISYDNSDKYLSTMIFKMM